MIRPYSTDLCGFYYVSIFNDFPCICCHMWSWEFPKSKYIKVELDPWILGAEIITANNFFLQPKLHLGSKGIKWSCRPCTVLQLEEISLARLQRVGVMKFSNTSFCCWTQLCLSQLLWNDWKIKTLPKAQRTRGLSSSFQSSLLGHITSSNTNLVQTSSSKSRPSIHFKIHTKHHHLD